MNSNKEFRFPVTVLPNILTYCNVAVGTVAIILAAGNLYYMAGMLIIIGAVFDRFDGKLARKYEVANELGKQLDSFADIVTFGIAPALTAYMLSFSELQALGMALAVTFVISGVYRLARFNILNNDKVFMGLPITAAGFLLTVLMLYQNKFDAHPYITAAAMIILSYSMVCKRQIKKM